MTRFRALAVVLVTLCLCSGISACGSGNDNGGLVVLVDSTRLAGVQKFEKQHPGIRIRISTLANRGQIPEKILLDNRAADGTWPDVVFAEPPIVARTADRQHHFPLDLRPYVQKSVLQHYSPGALKSCEIEGKLVCLPNDLAQEVLWYNAVLMKKFGYAVPTTWEQYEQLGVRVAKEHPGYIVGSFADSDAAHMYFWPSGCPIADITGPDTVHIDLSARSCTRVAHLADTLIEAGSLTTLSPVDAGFVQKYGRTDHILMMPEASWYAEYQFKTTYHTPKGQLAAAPPLRWSDQDTLHSGAQGGSAWMVSSHTKNVRQAVQIALWMSTSLDYQQTAPTYPAYIPAAQAWGRQLRHDAYFAADPFPVLERAANAIDPIWGSVRYDAETIFVDTVIAAVHGGHSVESALPKYQSDLTDLAKDYGYDVVSESNG